MTIAYQRRLQPAITGLPEYLLPTSGRSCEKSPMLRGRITEVSFEAPGEVGLVCETTPLSHLTESESRLSHKVDGPCQAAVQYERMRRDAHGIAEGTSEMRSTTAGNRAKLAKPMIACQSRFNVFNYLAGGNGCKYLAIRPCADGTVSVAIDNSTENRLSNDIEVKLHAAEST